MKPYQKGNEFFACGNPIHLRRVGKETHAFSPRGERLSQEDLTLKTVYGGGEGLDLDRVFITHESGVLQAVYGGGPGDRVGEVFLRVTGGAVRSKYVGGGLAERVGTVEMCLENPTAVHVITGSERESALLEKDARVTLSGGVLLNLHCGGGKALGSVTVTATGGRVEKQITDRGVEGGIFLNLPENFFVPNSQGTRFPLLPEKAVLCQTPRASYHEALIFPEREDNFFQRDPDRAEIRFFELRDPNLKKEDSPFPQFIGDCILITLPKGENMLVDTGLPYSEGEILSGLEKLGVARLDYLVVTHFHRDHMGNLLSLIDRFSVDTVVLPDVSCLPEADLIEPLNELFSRASRGEQKIRRVAAGDELSMGEAKFEILNPPFPGYSDAKLNDTSIVMKMTLWETTVLFTGDIGEKVEFRLIEEYGERLHCDFLKISHHGIVYQNHLRFFQAVSPRLAVAQNLRPEGVFMRVLRQVLEEHHGLPEENFFFTGRDGRLRAAIGKDGIEFYRQFD